MDYAAGGSRLATDIGDFFELMVNCSDQESRWQGMLSFMAQNGADQINYAVLNTMKHDRANAPVTQLSTMSEDWIGYYLDNRLDLHDPHVHYVRTGRLSPYRWSESAAVVLDDQKQRQVIHMAAEAGLRAQISLIAPDPIGGRDPIGGMTIGSSLDGAEFFSVISGKESMLLCAGMLFHQFSMGDIRRQQAGAQRLSPRERDCMTHLASGLRTTRIAQQLGLSESTVEMHLRNARKKLRAATAAQAVARAMVFGEISL